MKKKGLIISTVVMVIVLIASLTTATYAWFSTSSTASVDTITMNVGASSKVQIGVGSGSTPSTYFNGQVTFENDEWTGTPGLGSSINTGFVWAVDAGVGSGQLVTVEGEDGAESTQVLKMDTVYNPENTLYKANGKTIEDLGTLRPVNINLTTGCDVIDLNMGIQIVQGDVYGTICKLTITPHDTQVFMGMITAMHLEITVGNKTLATNDIFDLVGTGIHQSDNAQAYTFYFFIDELSDEAYTYGTGSQAPVKEFNLKFFISGYDEDCIDSATGTGATIDLDFDGCGADFEADSSWILLDLAA